jgi:hypothetical protein
MPAPVRSRAAMRLAWLRQPRGFPVRFPDAPVTYRSRGSRGAGVCRSPSLMCPPAMGKELLGICEQTRNSPRAGCVVFCSGWADRPAWPEMPQLNFPYRPVGPPSPETHRSPGRARNRPFAASAVSDTLPKTGTRIVAGSASR